MNGGAGAPDSPEAPQALLARHLSRWSGPAATGWLPSAEGRVVTSGPDTQAFAWASVTKLLVSLALWVAVEEGTTDFDRPAGPPGSTVGHLLAHSSGLPFEGHEPVARPGARRIYSNTGMNLAADHLAEASGLGFARYLSEAVLEPLGMTGTVLQGRPAHGAVGPLSDLLALARELMAPRLVSPGTLRRATSVAWPGLVGVVPGFGRQDPCDWGLGPERRGRKSPHWTGTRNSPHTFGHFGQSGAWLWVDPEAGVALAGLSHLAFGPWAKHAWPALADDVLAASGPPRPLSWWKAQAAAGGS
jgi:CubicO group peptidase (beta-lactamase class C family)